MLEAREQLSDLLDTSDPQGCMQCSQALALSIFSIFPPILSSPSLPTFLFILLLHATSLSSIATGLAPGCETNNRVSLWWR